MEDSEVRKFRPNPESKLMDQVREVLRYHHYAIRTEDTYCAWIMRFLKHFGGKTHPKDLNAENVEEFLSFLATTEKVAVSTQRQALNAIVFLYREVLDIPLGDVSRMKRSGRHRRPPTVLTQEEVKSLLGEMSGTHLLMAQLLYGCGLRLMECIRLRIQDVDFGRHQLFIRGAKGGKDRVVMIPRKIEDALKVHVDRVVELHKKDVAEGFGEVYVPEALARKFKNASRETGWQYLFPAKERSVDPRSGKTYRHHVLESGLQKAVKTAAQKAKIYRRVGCHTLRHSYATHLLENGTNIRVVQDLMGHSSVETTEIYTHVMQKDIERVESPLDGI